MSDLWYLADNLVDPRAENRRTPNAPVSGATLTGLHVFARHFDVKDISDDVDQFIRPLLSRLHFFGHDIVDIRPATLDEDKFESMAKLHFQEHLHEDDEVRLILEGEGYFDIRDQDDQWIRVLAKPGDCLVVPAGIYHRFTTGPGLYTKAIRLFRENPKWEALSRGPDADATPARAKYLASLNVPTQTVLGSAEGAKNGVYSIPYPFDDALTPIAQSVLQGQHPAKSAVVLFITGEVDPFTRESWSDAAEAVKPNVVQGVKALRDRLGDGVVYVESVVERPDFLDHPRSYLLGGRSQLAVTGVPTVLVLTPSAKHANAAGTANSSAKWFDLLQVKVRSTHPTTEEISEWA